METIIIMANALAKAAKARITRLDIQYNSKSESYSGRIWIDTKIESVFDIHENGTITLPH